MMTYHYYDHHYYDLSVQNNFNKKHTRYLIYIFIQNSSTIAILNFHFRCLSFIVTTIYARLSKRK